MKTPVSLPVYKDIQKRKRVLVIDMEAVGLLPAIREGDPSSMHVICCKDIINRESFIFFDPYEERDPNNREWLECENDQDGSLLDGIDFIQEAGCIIGHNISGFDFLAFEKVFGGLWKLKHKEYLSRMIGKVSQGQSKSISNTLSHKGVPYYIMDTYTMSVTLNPERKPPFQAYNIGRGNVGPHSIEAHGIAINRFKPENKDWTKLTDHMITRCSEDVEIGASLYWHLMKEWKEQAVRVHPRTGLFIGDAYMNELQTNFTIARQAERGFRLDMVEAIRLTKELDEKLLSTEAGFRPHMPKRLKKSTTVDRQRKLYWSKTGLVSPDSSSYYATTWDLYKKDGTFKKAVTDLHPSCRGNKNDYTGSVVGPYTKVQFEDVPMGNHDFVKQVLHKEGWSGVNYGEKDQGLIDSDREDELKAWAGKIDEDSLDAWSKWDTVPDWCKGIAEWYILSSRRNQILNAKDVIHFEEKGIWPSNNNTHSCKGLVAKAYNKILRMTGSEYYERYNKWPSDMSQEWRVPAEAFPCATNTFRMRHKKVVNIPKSGLYPLRYLFIAGIGMLILGCDASGLELRMLAHYMADKIYQAIVLNGDVHSHNQKLGGMSTRDIAKTFIYAFLYGSGIPNLAKVCGVSRTEMGGIIKSFKRELPALTKLITTIEEQGRANRYLLAPDCRRGRIRSSEGKLLVHTMLNVLLQMTGSICVKYSVCMAEDRMIEERVGLDSEGWPAWVANQHDEVQMEVPESEVEVITYSVPIEDYDDEEKKVYIKDGKLYTSPVVDEPPDCGEYLIKRYYHPVGQIIAESMTKAGEHLHLRCPTAGEYKIGKNWSETH